MILLHDLEYVRIETLQNGFLLRLIIRMIEMKGFAGMNMNFRALNGAMVTLKSARTGTHTYLYSNLLKVNTLTMP